MPFDLSSLTLNLFDNIFKNTVFRNEIYYLRRLVTNVINR